MHEVMKHLISGQADVDIEERQVDIDERASMVAMTETTCDRRKGIGSRPCSSQFSTDHLISVRASCSELDMVVMGQLMAGMNDSRTTSHHRNRERDRQRAAYTFHHQGKQVCEKMFRFLHNIGETRYKNLNKSLRSNGLATCTHGNINEYVVRFVLNYAEQHALLLPGRVPGYSRSDIKLQSPNSKRAIWKVYQTVATSDSIRAVGYSTFTSLWRSLLPSIILMKPMTDLC